MKSWASLLFCYKKNAQVQKTFYNQHHLHLHLKVRLVRKAVGEAKIAYPVGLDNDFATWLAYDNQYWPAKYLID